MNKNKDRYIIEYTIKKSKGGRNYKSVRARMRSVARSRVSVANLGVTRERLSLSKSELAKISGLSINLIESVEKGAVIRLSTAAVLDAVLTARATARSGVRKRRVYSPAGTRKHVVFCSIDVKGADPDDEEYTDDPGPRRTAKK